MKKIVYIIILSFVVVAVLSASGYTGKTATSNEIHWASEKATPTVALTAMISTDSTSSKVVDVVCKMKVEKSVKDTSVYKGKTYYFCSPYCKKEFDKNPEKHINV